MPKTSGLGITADPGAVAAILSFLGELTVSNCKTREELLQAQQATFNVASKAATTQYASTLEQADAAAMQQTIGGYSSMSTSALGLGCQTLAGGKAGLNESQISTLDSKIDNVQGLRTQLSKMDEFDAGAPHVGVAGADGLANEYVTKLTGGDRTVFDQSLGAQGEQQEILAQMKALKVTNPAAFQKIEDFANETKTTYSDQRKVLEDSKGHLLGMASTASQTLNTLANGSQTFSAQYKLEELHNQALATEADYINRTIQTTGQSLGQDAGDVSKQILGVLEIEKNVLNATSRV